MRLSFIDPSKPNENADIESFNGRLRDKYLHEHHF
jgi:Integrase core domain